MVDKLKNNLAQNMQFLMQHYQLTETEISRRTQVGQPVVHRMAYGTTDNPKIKTISPVANLFGLSISNLLRELPPENQLQVALSDNVAFGWHAVPLVSLSSLAKVTDVNGIDAVLRKTNNLAHLDIPPSDNTFAITVDDDSMAPQFLRGSVCFIEPSLRPKNGDFVVCALSSAPAAVFRKILFHGDDVYCQALNREFPTRRIEETYCCLGTMIQARVDI